MHKIIFRALLIAALYLAGSYYFDRPEELKQDAVALREMSTKLSGPEHTEGAVEQTGENVGLTIFDAKQRLDSVRGKVNGSIARGAERFAGSD